MESPDPAGTPPGGIRPTPIGPFKAALGSTNRTRTIPVPWIDCVACAWRHYPNTANGRWHIATSCANCGAPLDLPEGIDQAGTQGS